MSIIIFDSPAAIITTAGLTPTGEVFNITIKFTPAVDAKIGTLELVPNGTTKLAPVIRYVRNAVLLLKTESEFGMNSSPVPTENAILVSDVTVEMNYEMVDRKVIRPYFGGSEQLCGSNTVAISFTCELSGSGRAGWSPKWNDALLACGWKKTATDSYIEYTPDTIDPQSATISYFDGGILHVIVGFRGHAKISLKMDEIPTLQIDGIGLDKGTANKDVPASINNWRKPKVISENSVKKVCLGCNYAGGDITGGVKYRSTGLEIDLGGKVESIPLLGGGLIEITNREITGSCELALSVSSESSLYNNIKEDKTMSIGFVVGEDDGEICIIYGPSVQITKPKKIDSKGLRMIGVDLRFIPVVGDDELKIVVR